MPLFGIFAIIFLVILLILLVVIVSRTKEELSHATGQKQVHWKTLLVQEKYISSKLVKSTYPIANLSEY